MMNQQKKKRLRTGLIIGLIILCLGVYLWYILLYRTKVEPKTEATTTSTEAALYTLPQQLSVLRPFEEFYTLAIEGRATEENYGTIPIPGIDRARTLKSNKSETITMCTSMTPQGLAVAGDYLLISAYCHTHEHNSVVYVLDKNTHEYIKEIVLPGKVHAGGLAYDAQHHMIWVSTSNKGKAAASAFSMKSLREYDLDASKKPVAYTFNYDLYSIEKDSFMTYADGYLYVGHFSQSGNSVVQRFKIDVNGGLETKEGMAYGVDKPIALPEDIKQIPKLIQGFAVYEDKVILTQSYGIFTSKLLVHNYDDVMYRTSKKYTINKITLPQKLEQIYIDGNDLYILFESSAYAYSAQPLPKVDRVVKMRLSDVLKVDIDDLTSEADAIPEDEVENIVEEEFELIETHNLPAMVEFMAEAMKKGEEEEIYMDQIANMKAGEIVDEKRLTQEEQEGLFYAEDISDAVFARMFGVSFHVNDDITREDLRYVRVLHRGFDGETHIGELVVNQEIADETVQLFRELYKMSYPIEKMHLVDDYGGEDEASMADNNSSAFNYRTISNSNILSNHALGMAIDINPLYNPYVKTVNGELSCEPANATQYMDRSLDFDHKIDKDDLCYQIFMEHGFTWGGDWTTSKDYQHFEYGSDAS